MIKILRCTFDIFSHTYVIFLCFLKGIKNSILIGVNSKAQGFSVEVTMTDNSYFNISEIKLSITLLFSVQIMSYLGASDIIYSDVIDSFISEILKYKSWILVS